MHYFPTEKIAKVETAHALRILTKANAESGAGL